MVRRIGVRTASAGGIARVTASAGAARTRAMVDGVRELMTRRALDEARVFEARARLCWRRGLHEQARRERLQAVVLRQAAGRRIAEDYNNREGCDERQDGHNK